MPSNSNSNHFYSQHLVRIVSAMKLYFVISGVERICDLLDSHKVGENENVEDSIRDTVEKVTNIGND